MSFKVTGDASIDAGQWCANRLRRRPCGRHQTVIGNEWLGLRPAAEICPPIERISSPGCQHALAQHEQTQVESFMSDELLHIQDRPQLLEHFECAEGQRLIAQPRDPPPFAAENRLHDDVAPAARTSARIVKLTIDRPASSPRELFVSHTLRRSGITERRVMRRATDSCEYV